TRGGQAAGPLGRGLEQRAQRVVRPVELHHAEAPAILGGEVDAAERQIARHVLEEVDELQAGADLVAQSDGLRVVEPAQDAEHEMAAGVGGMCAVVLEVFPRLVLRDPLVHSIRSTSRDRKSTRLNSSHRTISYAVFCLKKKKKYNIIYNKLKEVML